MSQRLINIGTGPNTKDGDTVRQAFNLTNQNFTELYALLGQTEDSVLTTSIKGSVWADDSTLIVDGINGKIYATDVTTADIISDSATITGLTTEEISSTNINTETITYSYGVYTRTILDTVPADTPTVVWDSFVTDITSAKLVIQIEGSVNPDSNESSTWHTQVCEAHIVKRANFTTAPSISVYGITYTSAAALATFTAQYNVSTNKMEVVATAANAGYPLRVKIFATEFATSDQG